MQMGARWRAGETPHRGVPPLLYPAIAEAEASFASALTPHSSWTLTFLENRARCALDDILTVMVTASGGVATALHHDERAVLGTDAAKAGAAEGSGSGAGAGVFEDEDDDDDDWLS